jgi:hypothetical protein
MKKILILFFSFISISLAQQNKKIEYKVINDSLLTSIFNNIEILKEIKTDELTIRILSLNNDPGSAGYANGEVTSNIYIAVSEYDEYPEQKLFLIPNLYSPNIEGIKEEKRNVILLLSYIEKKKITLRIEITIDSIKINEI